MNIYLPELIKVGFQERKDTYTGKLGYVIAKEGGKWRKEHSWNGWITHYKEKVEKKYRETSDESFKPVIYKNELTEGFVLNKKAGGKGWSSRNIRRTVCRVYDPRGFSYDDWFYDLETRYINLKRKEEQKKLEEMKERLEAYLSEDYKANQEINQIKKELGL